MLDPRTVSFHEATVLAFALDAHAFVMRLEDVTTSAGSLTVLVTAERPTTVTADGVPWSGPHEPYEDGEVLTLTTGDGELRVIIEWHDWERKFACTRSYIIAAPSFSFAVVNE